jgi:hypothetical protein
MPAIAIMFAGMARSYANKIIVVLTLGWTRKSGRQ